MPELRRHENLIVTVDVECDSDGGPTWRYSSPASFRGVSHGLGDVLVPLLDERDAAATLFISNVVLEDDRSSDVIAGLGRVELATHLHGDFLDPERRHTDPAGAKTVENQHEYTDLVERMKLEKLGSMFQERFGRAPLSFRAGRWSAGGRTASLLQQLGYIADSSVSPGVHWTDGGRSVDYRRAPTQPYHPSDLDIATEGQLALWEFPVAIVPRWWTPGHPAWLRPSLSSFSTMRRVVVGLRRRHPAPHRDFVAMLHNTELTEGVSPYSRSARAASRVRRRLRDLLAWATDEGMSITTLAQAATARRIGESDNRDVD